MASLESELRSAQQLVSSQASELTQTQQLAVEYTALVCLLPLHVVIMITSLGLLGNRPPSSAG